MRKLFKRFWEQATLTPLRPVLIAVVLAAVGSSALPGRWGDELPALLFIAGILLAIPEIKLERAAQKRRGTKYPSVRSMNLRAGVLGLIAFLCLLGALLSGTSGDGDAAFGFAVVGAVFAALAWVYGVYMKTHRI